ncbi:Zn(II)2Cys6 transcription factor [Aspergillus luchuensis]|uniref:Uncharacterized protein n=2 Tax=Aspergillus kawachii TaxID=1069201 RepID=A0A7R7WZ04_ASPKA|nr:uncharacterized protein AKAW2_40925S [Aspergillus luchuensis]BCR99242.1 hypothetical protein AKAW2_40925S [Aspergillus luchuensis]BCS11550.1 hypothetical protein ALUC_40890S [Aspergillus luchuensis]
MSSSTMGVQEPAPKKRTRVSHTKVRTGCRTCRIRHKKCDETRPICRMCSSTGRICDGYQQTIDRRTRASKLRLASTSPSSTSSSSSTVSVPSSLVSDLILHTNEIDLTRQERWYLDFFRRNTAFQCSGYFDDDFWLRLVHQVTEAEPAVRHAAIALSALHCNFERTTTGQGTIDSRLPLQQCVKAISSLRHQLAGGGVPSSANMEITLVTCVLFVSFMFLQGDTQSACCHLRGGLKLLKEWRSTGKPGYSTTGAVLMKVFARLQLQWSTFADEVFIEEVDSNRCDAPYMEINDLSLEEPTDSLEKAGSLLVRLGRLVLTPNPSDPSSPGYCTVLDSRRMAILNKLQRWTTELDDSMTCTGNTLLLRDSTILTVLKLWSEIIYIMAATETRLGGSETRFDAFHLNFGRAVALAKILLLSTPAQSTMPNFSIGMGIIPPLFFCAFKCRDWYIRREAVQLLRSCQRQEGLWTTPGAVLVLERLIDIESKGLMPGDLVPESRRIDSIHVNILPDDHKIGLWYRRSSRQMGLDGSGMWEKALLDYHVG